MSGKLLKIKSKIKATNKTKKITKALELIAASKMKSFQLNAIHTQDYEKVLVNTALSYHDLDFVNIYTEERTIGKKLFILYTSDKGFCGPLNTKLINTLINSNEWKETTPENRLLITFGRKGYNYARNNKISVVKSYEDLDEKISILRLSKIIDEILSFWDKELIQELFMISPQFKNTFVYYPKLEKFLPLNFSSAEDTCPNSIYEPNSQDFLNGIYLKIIFAKFYKNWMELKATEYSSRMLAMQNSTNSASEIITSLTLKYNKNRQETITNEIIEVLGSTNND